MSFVQNLKIRNKILLVFSVIALVYVANVIYNFYGLSVITENVTSIYQNRMQSINALLEADRDSYQSRMAISESIIALKEGGSDFSVDLSENIASMNENLEQVATRFNLFKEAFLSTGGDHHNAFNIFEENYGKVQRHTNQIESLIQNGDVNELENYYFKTYLSDYETMRDAIDQLTAVSYEQTEKEYNIKSV